MICERISALKAADDDDVDMIDKMVEEKLFAENHKLCIDCNEVALKTQGICGSCKGRLQKKNDFIFDNFVGEKINSYEHLHIVPIGNKLPIK